MVSTASGGTIDGRACASGGVARGGVLARVCASGLSMCIDEEHPAESERLRVSTVTACFTGAVAATGCLAEAETVTATSGV